MTQLRELERRVTATLMGTLTEDRENLKSLSGGAYGQAGEELSYEEMAARSNSPDRAAGLRSIDQAIKSVNLQEYVFALEAIGLEFYRNQQLREAVRQGRDLTQFVQK